MEKNELSERKSNTASNIGALAVVLMVLFYVSSVLYRAPPDQYKKNVQEQLIADTIEQYKIDRKSGSLMEICVQAGIVAGAYKSTLDEENYRKWKEIERDDCSKVGVLPS